MSNSTSEISDSRDLYSEPTFKTVNRNEEDLEFKLVEHNFRKTLPRGSQFKITSIDFVKNSYWQQKFENKKAEFREAKIPDVEIFAYHGTPPENIRSICKSNLNRIKRTSQGVGYYFSEHPEFSLGYGSGLLMFKLLPGLVYVGPDKFGMHIGSSAKYQSKEVKAIGGELHGNQIIIANNEQFVPYCVIHVATPAISTVNLSNSKYETIILVISFIVLYGLFEVVAQLKS